MTYGYLDFLHARTSRDGTSNINVSGKISVSHLVELKILSLILIDNLFSILSELRELSNKEIKMVGHRISFSDNLQKLKFIGRFSGLNALPW